MPSRCIQIAFSLLTGGHIVPVTLTYFTSQGKPATMGMNKQVAPQSPVITYDLKKLTT